MPMQLLFLSLFLYLHFLPFNRSAAGVCPRSHIQYDDDDVYYTRSTHSLYSSPSSMPAAQSLQHTLRTTEPVMRLIIARIGDQQSLML